MPPSTDGSAPATAPILPLLKETFFIGKKSVLGAKRRSAYNLVLVSIILIHAVGFAFVYFLTTRRNTTASPDAMAYYFTLLQGVGVLSSLIIVLLSLKSEALISQTYELASASTQAASHEFREFRDHLIWLKDNLTPEKFPDTQHLFITVSTPLYGIGANDGSQNDFLEYFESWVLHFENLNKDQNAHPPIWDFTVWNKEDNITTFGSKHFDWSDQTHQSALAKFGKLLDRVYTLHRENRLDFRLYVSDASHARLFMANAGSHRMGGIVVLFSPLTASTIQHRKWALLGFSFRDAQAFHNISRFNLKLQTRDHSKARPNGATELLENAGGWLAAHYGLV